MNPILNRLKPLPAKPSLSNEIKQMMSDVQSGKVDAKQKVLGMMKNLSPQQKQAISQMLPNLTKLGKVFGASDQNISAFTAELKRYL